MDQIEALSLVRKILALALLTQSLEFLRCRREIALFWPRKILGDQHLSAETLTIVFFIRLVLSVSLFWNLFSPVVLILAATQYLLYRHFKGPFNGGSDTMTSLLLLTLCVASLLPKLAPVCLIYIAVQSALSYFVAGVIKWRQPTWRSGKALNQFLTLHNVPLDLGAGAAWALILFECLMPLSLVTEVATLPLLSLALAFHFMNAFYLGLNRFVLAWLATYPAIIYCSGL